jgi:hypothetical protein
MKLAKYTNEKLSNIIKLSFMMFIFTGCSEQIPKIDNLKIFNINEIPKTIKLSGKKHFFEPVKMPDKIYTKNGKLIIGESRRLYAELPPIHIIDAQNMAYLRSLGKVGFGPGEISDVSGIDLGYDENSIWIYSAMEKRFSEFLLDDTTSLSKNQIKQAGDFYMAMAMTWSSDSTVMCRLVNDPHQFAEFHIDGRRLVNYGNWEDILVRKDLTNYMMSDLHFGWFKGSQLNNVYASAGAYRDRIEILNRENGIIIITDGPINYIPKFDIVDNRGSSGKLIVDIGEPLAYLDIVITGNNILGLYTGKTEKQLSEESEIARDIYVFDLEGNIISKIELDISIRALAVDEKSKKIFGITTDEDPGIAVFDLPSLN